MTPRLTPSLLVMVVPMLLTACTKGSAAKLEGRWHGIKATGVPSTQVTAANLFASTMELEFHGEQVSVHTGGDKQSTRFRVARDEKNAVVIVTDADGADDKQTFTFVDDKTLDWTVTPGTMIEFARE